ncbi:hypothetical protein NQ314_018705 [Rhamnusium bicolor]|uniref:Uncharacterized protein n=1 Tax=Rhamnusium bicolor TaxID=1586634 RepID=A0AAV8WQY0_9CUCU|nr:hypothetical protein NQ314_018705 [Rhamnusium bicolor]
MGTSAMNNHLKIKHNEKFAEIRSSIAIAAGLSIFISSTNKSAPVPSQKIKKIEEKQLTLTEIIERKLMWDISDAKLKEYHYLIREMIALDNKPLSMMDRVGFRRLMQKALPRYKIPSRTNITDKIVPDI